MSVPESVRRVRPRTLFLILSSMFVAAGGVIHLREWLDVYRHVPAAIPGAAVVRVGFPLNTAASFVLVVALVLVVWRPSRVTQAVIIGALVIQTASLAMLIATRNASVFGWSEPAWTRAAEQTRAVEVAAIAALLVLASLVRIDRRETRSLLADARAQVAS